MSDELYAELSYSRNPPNNLADSCIYDVFYRSLTRKIMLMRRGSRLMDIICYLFFLDLKSRSTFSFHDSGSGRLQRIVVIASFIAS